MTGDFTGKYDRKKHLRMQIEMFGKDIKRHERRIKDLQKRVHECRENIKYYKNLIARL